VGSIQGKAVSNIILKGCVAGITLRREEALRTFQSGSDSAQASDELRLSRRVSSV
jgi:hypothetical protein